MDDFDYGEEEPKKGFFQKVFTKPQESVNMEQRSRKMPEPMSDDLMKLLGGAYKGPDDQNMALDYVGNSYVPIGDSYRPIAETYKKSGYEPGKWEDYKFEPPVYESASGVLFGEQGKAWEDSPVFKRSGIGLWDEAEKSPVFTKTGMSDILFGNKDETPMLNPISGRPMEFPMKNPNPETIPFQRVSPVTQFAPSPVIVGQPQMAVPQFPVVPPQYIPPPMPTMPTQVMPPQYIPTAPVPQFKRPVGRPRLYKPPKIKRPVGRPRKVKTEETQMTEMAQ